jgi:Flp pilus assembly protein TadD
MTTVLFLLIVLFALGVLGYLFWNKWHQLQLLDPDSLPEAQTRKLKNELLKQRMTRVGDAYVKRAQKDLFKPLALKSQEAIRRVAGKLTAAERSFKRKQMEEQGVDPDMLADMMKQAKQLYDEQDWDRTEKMLIELISVNARYADAYELLGRVYMAKKEYGLAQETFVFLQKLAPHDASVLANLGEVSEKRGEKEQAFTYFQQAMEISPKNPKYLDFVITAGIETDHVDEAFHALERLRAVNPDNSKIEEFSEKIREKRQK